MTHPNKIKGNRFENEVVATAKKFGLEAVRSWGSNGKSLGQHEECDVMIEKITVQAKIRKSLPKWIEPSEHIDWQVIRADRCRAYVVMPLDSACQMLKENNDAKK